MCIFLDIGTTIIVGIISSIIIITIIIIIIIIFTVAAYLRQGLYSPLIRGEASATSSINSR